MAIADNPAAEPSGSMLAVADAQRPQTPGHPLASLRLAVVVPAYNEAALICETLRSIPAYVRHLIVVDDGSQDDTAECVEGLAVLDPRIELVRHSTNQGLGAAMASGLRRAAELRADIIIKMDGDGQMDPDELPRLLQPLVTGDADYAKGNRFRDFRALRQMPLVRRIGNMALSFLTKAAVGYWDCFDPCNGYVAIRGELLDAPLLDRLPRSFFFETSMLGELYLRGAVIRDVPMPARYGSESSHLSIRRVLCEFPWRLLGCLVRRLVLKNLVDDFCMETIYLLTGVPLLLGGILYGGAQWLRYTLLEQAAPTGTVVIPAMLIILGFQLLLSAIAEDMRRAPRDPLFPTPLLEREVTCRVQR